jgi:hypothetical protein
MSFSGLGGELRGGKRLEERIREAQKMGFQRIIVPKASASKFSKTRTTTATMQPATVTTGEKISNAKSSVIECRTLFDVLAVAFVHPEVSQTLSSKRRRKPGAASAAAAAVVGLHGPSRHFRSPREASEEEVVDYFNECEEVE